MGLTSTTIRSVLEWLNRLLPAANFIVTPAIKPDHRSFHITTSQPKSPSACIARSVRSEYRPWQVANRPTDSLGQKTQEPRSARRANFTVAGLSNSQKSTSLTTDLTP